MSQTSLKQRRDQYRQALDRALADILDQLARMPEVEKVILFGSYAAGRRDLFTDLDLLVVMATERDFVHRTADLAREGGWHLACFLAQQVAEKALKALWYPR